MFIETTDLCWFWTTDPESAQTSLLCRHTTHSNTHPPTHTPHHTHTTHTYTHTMHTHHTQHIHHTPHHTHIHTHTHTHTHTPLKHAIFEPTSFNQNNWNHKRTCHKVQRKTRWDQTREKGMQPLLDWHRSVGSAPWTVSFVPCVTQSPVPRKCTAESHKYHTFSQCTRHFFRPKIHSLWESSHIYKFFILFLETSPVNTPPPLATPTPQNPLPRQHTKKNTTLGTAWPDENPIVLLCRPSTPPPPAEVNPGYAPVIQNIIGTCTKVIEMHVFALRTLHTWSTVSRALIGCCGGFFRFRVCLRTRGSRVCAWRTWSTWSVCSRPDGPHTVLQKQTTLPFVGFLIGDVGVKKWTSTYKITVNVSFYVRFNDINIHGGHHCDKPLLVTCCVRVRKHGVRTLDLHGLIHVSLNIQPTCAPAVMFRNRTLPKAKGALGPLRTLVHNKPAPQILHPPLPRVKICVAMRVVKVTCAGCRAGWWRHGGARGAAAQRSARVPAVTWGAAWFPVPEPAARACGEKKNRGQSRGRGHREETDRSHTGKHTHNTATHTHTQRHTNTHTHRRTLAHTATHFRELLPHAQQKILHVWCHVLSDFLIHSSKRSHTHRYVCTHTHTHTHTHRHSPYRCPMHVMFSAGRTAQLVGLLTVMYCPSTHTHTHTHTHTYTHTHSPYRTPTSCLTHGQHSWWVS